MEKNTANWYALKVFYNKVFELEDLLKDHIMESYVPIQVVEKIVKGERTYVQKPAISSLLFILASDEQAERLLPVIEGKAMFYRNVGSKLPTAIPEREMRIFKLVTSVQKDGLDFLDGNIARFCTGQRVRVTAGPFQGCEGFIHRIKGNRRLVVTIEGIVAVATSYIPAAFLQPM